MELFNKTKTFIKKHKRGVCIAGCIVGGIMLKTITKNNRIKYGKECFMAGSRMSTIADITAMEKILDKEKTNEVMTESVKITKNMCETLVEYDIKPEAFNKMYESGIIETTWSQNK